MKDVFQHNLSTDINKQRLVLSIVVKRLNQNLEFSFIPEV